MAGVSLIANLHSSGCVGRWTAVTSATHGRSDTIDPGFSTFFYHVPQFFCQEGDVPTIRILLKNTNFLVIFRANFSNFCQSESEVSLVSHNQIQIGAWADLQSKQVVCNLVNEF